jgi:hypothetical protein
VLVHPRPKPAAEEATAEGRPVESSESPTTDAPEIPGTADEPVSLAPEATAGPFDEPGATDQTSTAGETGAPGRTSAAGRSHGGSGESAPGDESTIDTQPLRQIRDVPEPGHVSEVGDPEDQARTGHKPYGEDEAETGDEGSVPLAPPSGRMRSTPRPPA